VAHNNFDVSDSAFQDEFAELTEPGSGANDLAVFAPEREKRRLDVRALVVGRIILQYIIRDAVPAEFPVTNYWFNSFCTQSLAKEPPVVPFVSGENAQFVEVPLHHLPADLGVVRLFHRARYVENRICIAVDQRGHFHRLERVVRPLCVVLAGSDPIHAGCVNRLNVADVVQFRRQP